VPAVGGAPTVTYQNFFNAASLPIVLPAGLTWGVSPDIGTPYSMIYLFISRDSSAKFSHFIPPEIIGSEHRFW
jgi:hypothetical protein